MNAIVGLAVFVIFIVVLWSVVWAVMRWGKGGQPMSDAERDVPSAEGGSPPSVFGGGGVSYRQPGL